MTPLPKKPAPMPPTMVALAADQGLAAIHVEVQSLIALNQEMNRSLVALEKRFADFARPAIPIRCVSQG